MNRSDIHREKVILFDGVCNLCNRSVIFVLQHEIEPIFKFASIQSRAGRKLLGWCGLPSDYSEAVVLIDNGKIYLGSTAALKIGSMLKFSWSALSHAVLFLPKLIRDLVYNQIGRHRYDF